MQVYDVLKFLRNIPSLEELNLKVSTEELVFLLALLIGKQRSQTIQVLH